MVFNLMTCQGWGEASGFMGPCSIAWLFIALLFYIVLISRKQIGENLGLFEYNLIGGIAGAYVPFLIIITLIGEAKWAFLGGLIGSLVGGYLGGMLIGGSEYGIG